MLHPSSSSSHDSQVFLEAWNTAEQHDSPYTYYLLKNTLENSIVDGLLELPISSHTLDYNLGTREEFNSTRQYVTPGMIAQHDAAKRVADVFLDPTVIADIERKGNINLKGSLLRIEYAVDTNKFWLKPHTDLGVKLFTMLIYLSKDEGAEDWGTDVYADAETYVCTAPFRSNAALCFIPSNNTWHGFRPRTINGIRKSLIVNYVTQEWRNRQELVHPTNPVY